MGHYFIEAFQRVNAGEGFLLSLIGMGIVFSGLISLFFAMIIMRKTIDLYRRRQSWKLIAQKKAELLEGAINMEEISAAIGLALHLYSYKHRSYRITIKRLTRSSWKDSLRAKAMERL